MYAKANKISGPHLAENDYRFHGCSFDFFRMIFFFLLFFASIKTEMKINPQRSDLCTFLDIVFSGTVRSRFSPHNSQRIDANTDAYPFQRPLCFFFMIN